MQQEPELVASVIRADVNLSKSMPPILTVMATGEVPTGGWSDAELSAAVYIDPPADGIQDYDFNARRPSGQVTQAFEQIEAESSWEDPAQWIRGVRIKAAENSLEAMIGDAEEKD